MKNSPFVILALFFAFVAFESWNLYQDEHETATRLLSDLKTKGDSCKFYRTRDGKNAVKIQSQELTIRELRATIPEVIEAAKNAGIRPALLTGYTKATTETKADIKAPIEHRKIVKNADTIRVGVINYHSPYFDISGTIYPDTAYLKPLSRDTIEYFPSRGRRVHPWAWILSKRKPDEVTITNKNPDCKITILQSVKIKF